VIYLTNKKNEFVGKVGRVKDNGHFAVEILESKNK
jgi:hypothetical protein